jgi:hypothetical protein
MENNMSMKQVASAVAEHTGSVTKIVDATASAVVSTGQAVKETASAVAPSISKVSGFMGDKLIQYWNASEEILKAFAPQALDAILWVIRVDAITSLVYAWLMIAAFVYALFYLKKVYNHFNAKQEAATGWSDRDGYSTAKFLIPGVTLVIMIGIYSATTHIWTNAVNAWTYITVWKPELYVAKVIVDGGTEKLKAMTGQNTVK